MGNAGAKVNGMDEAPMKFSDTIRMLPLQLEVSKDMNLIWYSGDAQGH